MMSNNEGSQGGISNVRIIISVVIIVGCFTVIYPRFFHPIVLKMLGMSPKPAEPPRPMHPPSHHHPGGPPGREHIPDDIKRHMRPGPHPGMRASAEMNNQKQTGSGRGGIMGMVLPMYAVGIVVYLIYTLFKVFNKQGKGDIRRRRLEEQQYRKGLSPKPRYGEQEPSLMGDFQYAESPEEKLANIEEVLSRVEDKNISEKQMQELQRRLQETEAQMASILKAMNSVSMKVADAAEEGAKTEEEQLVKDTDKDSKSSDSSPDISSYEVIDKSKGDKSKTTTPTVETLMAGEAGKGGVDEEEKTPDKEEVKEEDEMKETEEAEEVLLEEKKDEDEDVELSVRKRKVHQTSD